MPYLAGDKSMKVKLKCPCVRALKGKVVSMLILLVQARPVARIPLCQPGPSPAHYDGHPRVLTLTSGPGKVECSERGAGLCRPPPYLGITCGLGRETGARLGCPDMPLCTLLSLTRPGLGPSCHDGDVTSHDTGRDRG